MERQKITEQYVDIIRLPYPLRANRPHMALQDRAAQFAPFAALSGYEELVAEEARLTDREIELSDSEIEIINRVIRDIHALVESGAHPDISVICFQPDPRKKGGRYLQRTGTVKRIDPIRRQLILYGSAEIENRRIPTVDIPIESIIEISVVR